MPGSLDSIISERMTQSKLREIFQKMGLGLQANAIQKSNFMIDSQNYHKMIDCELRKMNEYNAHIESCKTINQKCIVKRQSPSELFSEKVKKTFEHIGAPPVDPKTQEIEVEESIERLFKEKGLEKNEDGIYVSANQDDTSFFSGLFEFHEATRSHDFQLIVHNYSKTNLIEYTTVYWSQGQVFRILLEKEFEMKGNKQIEKSSEMRVIEEFSLFEMDDEGKYLNYSLNSKKDTVLLKHVKTTRGGNIHDITESISKPESNVKDYMARKNLSYKDKYLVFKRSEQKKYIYDESTVMRKTMTETTPNLAYILDRHYKLTDKTVCVVPDCFILIREVVKSEKDKEDKFFLEPVFVTITKGNSKVEDKMTLDKSIDYRFRIFFLERTPESLESIKMVIAKRADVFDILSSIKMYIHTSNDTVTQDIEYPNRVSFMFDRRIAIKLNLKNADGSESTNDDHLKEKVISKQKEYQTKSQLKERMLSMHRIVQKETAGVRYVVGLDDKKKDGKGGKKKTEAVRNPDEVFEFNGKFEKTTDQLYVTKTITYENLETNEHVEETLIEPSIKHIVDYIRKRNPEHKYEAYENIEVDHQKMDLKFIISNSISENHQTRRNKEEDWTSTPDIESEPILKLHETEFADRTSDRDVIFRGWKPDEAQRTELLHTRGYFALDEENTKIHYYGYEATHVFTEYFKLHKQPMEKEIIQNAIFSKDHDIIYFSEMKCNILTKNKTLMTASKLFPPSMNKCEGEIPDFTSRPKHSTTITEDLMKRTVVVTMNLRSEKITYEVVEPNLKTLYSFLHYKHGSKETAAAMWANKLSPEHIEKLFNVEASTIPPKFMYTERECKGHKNCLLANSLNTFMILSRVTIKCETNNYTEKYAVPKLVQLKCLEGNKGYLELMDNTLYGQMIFSLNNEILGKIDLSESLLLLEKETQEARDMVKEEVAYTKYKQRIQRCIKPIKANAAIIN